jgi:hypothetical protein
MGIWPCRISRSCATRFAYRYANGASLITLLFTIVDSTAYTRAIRLFDRETGDEVPLDGDTYTLEVTRTDFRGEVISIVPTVDPTIVNRMIFNFALTDTVKFDPGIDYVGHVTRDSDGELMFKVKVEVEHGAYIEP